MSFDEIIKLLIILAVSLAPGLFRSIRQRIMHDRRSNSRQPASPRRPAPTQQSAAAPPAPPAVTPAPAAPHEPQADPHGFTSAPQAEIVSSEAASREAHRRRWRRALIDSAIIGSTPPGLRH